MPDTALLPGVPPLKPAPLQPAQRWLLQARQMARWSADPKVRTACLLVRQDRVLASGIDSFPHTVKDTLSRRDHAATRAGMLLPCEAAAVAQAARNGAAVVGTNAYIWPLPTSAAAAALLIDAGCQALIWPAFQLPARMQDDYAMIREMAFEAGVVLRQVSEATDPDFAEG